MRGYIDMNKHHTWMFTSHITTDAEIVQTGITLSPTSVLPLMVMSRGMFKNISSELYSKIANIVKDIRTLLMKMFLPKYANLKLCGMIWKVITDAKRLLIEAEAGEVLPVVNHY